MSAPQLTRNQALVLDVLEEAKSPLSAYTILDHLREEGLRAPLQIYRALDKLLDLRLVHRLESINSFVACAHPQCHTQGLIAFAICEICGQVAEFSDADVQQGLLRWGKANGFSTDKTIIELRGTCAECRAA